MREQTPLTEGRPAMVAEAFLRALDGGNHEAAYAVAMKGFQTKKSLKWYELSYKIERIHSQELIPGQDVFLFKGSYTYSGSFDNRRYKGIFQLRVAKDGTAWKVDSFRWRKGD